MATINTNNQYQGAIKNDSKDLKNDAYRLKNDVTQYGRQAGADTRDAVKQASHDTREAAYSGSMQAYSTTVSMMDQVVSPETRANFYNGVKSFCLENPYIAVSSPFLAHI